MLPLIVEISNGSSVFVSETVSTDDIMALAVVVTLTVKLVVIVDGEATSVTLSTFVLVSCVTVGLFGLSVFEVIFIVEFVVVMVVVAGV